MLTNIGVDTATTLYAGALVVELIFPSMELRQSILILAIVSGLYAIAGGLKAIDRLSCSDLAVVLVISTCIFSFLKRSASI